MKRLHILFLFACLLITFCEKNKKEITEEEFFANEEKSFLEKIHKMHGQVEIGTLEEEPNRELRYMEYLRKKELEELEKEVLKSIKAPHEKDLTYEFETQEESKEDSSTLEENLHNQDPIHDEL